MSTGKDPHRRKKQGFEEWGPEKIREVYRVYGRDLNVLKERRTKCGLYRKKKSVVQWFLIRIIW